MAKSIRRPSYCKTEEQKQAEAAWKSAARGGNFYLNGVPTADMAFVMGWLERSRAHTDHPSKHWDRTCPACQGATDE
jgi:hypothetical protein